MKIKKLRGREILDSRGWPTIECYLELEGGIEVVASVPSGASVGHREAIELRDGDKKRFLGKGVLKAITNLEKVISPALAGRMPDLVPLDKLLSELDGTAQKSKLGANATLAASLAVTRAQALINGLEVYQLIQKLCKVEKVVMPYCMFNILNGGVHADNGIPFQEFMVVPVNQPSCAAGLEVAVLVYQALKKILKQEGYTTTVGDEGGFAPVLRSTVGGSATQVLDLLMLAVEQAGLTHEQVVFALDVAASQFYDAKTGTYQVDGRRLDRAALVESYADLVQKYPIFSIEDGMAEDDWAGWSELTGRLGGEVQLVGDDLFVTNCEHIQKGIDQNIANAVLIKPNQIGTVSEAIQAILLAQAGGYKTVISHRSGETNDSFIADLVVGSGAGQFKAGAPVRGERVAKYNRLVEIEQQIL